MQSALLRLSLLPAPAEFRIASGVVQAEFSKLRTFLRVRGVLISTPMFYRDDDPEAGGFAGEYVVPLVRAIEPAMETFLIAWLHAESGRKARLRVGDDEIEASSVEEAQDFLRHVLRLRQAPSLREETQAST